MNELEFLETCNKEQFVEFAQNFNIFKTKLEPNYLLVKNKILELLSIHELTVDDIVPKPRQLIQYASTRSVK